MPEEIKEPEEIEVEAPKIIPGNVRIMNKAAFTNPAPRILKIILLTVKKFSIYTTGVITGTDIINAHTAKVLVIVVALIYGLCDAIEAGVGVESKVDTDKRELAENN
ncbi:MAG TPA: hypothetical protein VMY77_03170 [Chitinophagaceae bacterium]|nr:hypothetical protein [Chitinophagaceae bacterium]